MSLNNPLRWILVLVLAILFAALLWWLLTASGVAALGDAPAVYETGSPAPTTAEVEPNAAYADATPIGLGDVAAGKIAYPGDRDTFLFTPSSSTTFLVDIDAAADGSALDPVVCVYDSQYLPPQEIDCNDNSNGLDALVYYYTNAPVYIRVSDANHPDEGGPAYSYKLSVYRPLLVSAAIDGTVAGIPFTKSDVLAHHDFSDGTERWMLFFDASDVGLTQNLVALDAPDQSGEGFSFALAAAQTLPVYNPPTGDYRPQAVRPQDAMIFTPLNHNYSEPYGQFGPTTLGRFFFGQRGADRGLTTATEKIDALGGGVSTTGKAVFPNGVVAQDEDLADIYNQSVTFDGSATPGLAAEDVVGADATEWNTDRFAYDRALLVIQGSGRVGGLAVTQKDIFAVDALTGTVLGRVWSGPAHHFNYAIDAFDAVDPYTE